MDSHQFYRSL